MHNPFGHHHPEPQQPYQAPHGSQYPQPIQGEIVKIYCEANPDFFLAGRNGSVVMAPANESDPSQQWIMDTSWSVKAKDDEGFPAFALVNKATGQALRHGRAEKDKVTLGPYHPDDLNEAVLFTQSADVGKGYQCIRPVHNTHLNLDASAGDDKHHVALREGAEIVLCKWNKKESQKWKISPILGASQGVHPPRGEQSSFYPPQANVEPQGHTVRIHCEANPEFFLAARGDVAVLALENPHDPHQQWIKVDSWGLRVKDEAGFPAFALVNKATRHALKHGDKEWDQIFLADYNHDKAEQAVLWTLSADVGNGYQCLRPVNNVHLNMDAKAADGHVGGIRDGNELILFEWKKQSNQKWKLQPVH